MKIKWKTASNASSIDDKKPSEFLNKLIEEEEKKKITTKNIIEALKKKYGK